MLFKPQTLHEVYFGKTPSIQKIENQLDKFRSKYIGSYVFNMSVNSDKDLLLLNRMFEDQFGFGCFTLNIINQPQINAFTMPISHRFDVQGDHSKNLLVDKNSYKFNKVFDYACLVCIYSGVIFNDNFTTPEVMAIILHEIGHNFYASIRKKNGGLANLYSALYAVQIFLDALRGQLDVDIFTNTNSWRSSIDKMKRDLRENDNVLIALYDFAKQVQSIGNVIVGGAAQIIDVLTLGALNVILAIPSLFAQVINPFTYVVLPISYADERLADNFPTMYGYGPDLASSMRKFEGVEAASASAITKAVQKIPVVSHIYNTMQLCGTVIMTAMDPHPTGIARAKDQLDMLEYELKKTDLDPKMRKYIQADVETCKAEIEKYIDTSKGLSDSYFARHAYNKMLYSQTGCKAIKDRILKDRNKFSDFDDYFDELLNKK